MQTQFKIANEKLGHEFNIQSRPKSVDETT